MACVVKSKRTSASARRSRALPAVASTLATRRAETYAAPGALPDVRAGTREQDLLRRDFTVNAIAVALGDSRRGELRAAPGALDDLAAARLRVLHDASFRDDPTRLLRLARYAARLGFAPDEQHARVWPPRRSPPGRWRPSRRARIGAELRLMLAERDAVAALQALDDLGALAALHQSLTLDAPLARAALEALPQTPDAWPDVLLLATLLLPQGAYDAHDYETRLRVLLDGWEFPAAERERAVHSALLAPRLVERLRDASAPSQVYEVVHDAPLEAVALAVALADASGEQAAASAARRWLAELRHVTLQIGGDDLLDAGIAAGPELGRRLHHALMRKLDGGCDGRDDELRAALEEL